MPIRNCPRCGQATARLVGSPSNMSASVNYYRCERCGQVWTLPKDDPDAPPTLITHADN